MLRVPPLRDRRSDVPELANHFLAAICARFGVRGKRVAPEALDVLMAYDWKKNNVRELRNIIERMIIAADADFIRADQVPVEVKGRVGSESISRQGTFVELKAEAERRIVVTSLERNNWHIAQTAKELGLADHASLLKIMRRHKLRRQ